MRPSYRPSAALSEKEAVVREVTCFRAVSTSTVYFPLTTTGLNLEVFNPLGVAFCVDGGLSCILPGVDTQRPYFPVGEAVFSNGCGGCCLCQYSGGSSCVACIRPSSRLIYVSGFVSVH